MRNLISLSAFFAGIVLFSACKEKGPYIDFGGDGVAKSVDTTYVITPPAAQQKKVLIEEFTGAKCSNCPDARVLLNSLSAQNPDRLVIMGIHIFNFLQSEPVSGSKHDFRTQDGTDIGNLVYGSVSGMPSAGIDRNPNAKSELLLLKPDWAAAVSARLALPTEVNLSITSNYNAAADSTNIKVTVTYLKPMTGQQYLSLAVIEDELVDKQDTVRGVIEEYEFQHVLRDFVTAPAGMAISMPAVDKEAGRVYEKVFPYKVSKDWKADKLHIIAFLHNNEGGNKSVLQAAEIHMK